MSGKNLPLITCAKNSCTHGDAGIICTSDLWEIHNTLLIIRDSLRSSSHDIVGYFCQPRVMSGVFYVLTPQSLSIAAMLMSVNDFNSLPKHSNVEKYIKIGT